jgi:tetratricopeptide (TPR) repeat protein
MYRRRGRLEEVVPLIEDAIARNPNSALLWQTDLRVLTDLGRFSELRRTGERWLQVAPRLEIAYREYAMALRRIGDERGAEDLLVRGLSVAQRPEALASELADLYASQRRWDDAAEHWIFVYRESPGAGWDLIAYKLDALGTAATGAAAAILERIEDDRSVESQKLAAIVALYAGRPDAARDAASSVLDRLDARGRRDFATEFSRVAARTAQPELVAWAYRSVLSDVPEDSTRWDLAQRIVQHDLSAGDTTSATDLLDDFVESADPGTPPHRWAGGMRIRLLAAVAELRDAERALQRYVELYPDDPDLPVYALAVAEANIRRGRLEAANRALELVPDGGTDARVGARLSAARAYLALYTGDFEVARAQFEVAAAGLTGPERSEALRFFDFLRDGSEKELAAVAEAHRSLLQGRPLQAYDVLADGLRSAPPSAARPAILLWGGELAIEGGSLGRAEQFLRRIPELYERSGEAPVAMMVLAEALAAGGRGADAITLLEELILEYPESALTPLGRRRLAELKEEVPRS